MEIENYSCCRTNRAGLVVARLDVFGITNTLFSTVFRFGVIAETLSDLDATTTGECARVPWWPGSPVPIDCGQQGENINDFFLLFSLCNTFKGFKKVESYLGMETSDTSQFADPLQHSSCLQTGAWGSYTGGYGWWHQHHRWQSKMTKATSDSSCRLAWLKATNTGQRSAIKKQTVRQWWPKQNHIQQHKNWMTIEILA